MGRPNRLLAVLSGVGLVALAFTAGVALKQANRPGAYWHYQVLSRHVERSNRDGGREELWWSGWCSLNGEHYDRAGDYHLTLGP